MARHKLTDEAWDLIKHLFPKRAETGRPPVDRRLVFDGILWILRTGAPWRDLPKSLVSGKQRGGCLTSGQAMGRLTQFSTCFVLPTLMQGKSIRSCGAWMGQLFAQHVVLRVAEKKGSR